MVEHGSILSPLGTIHIDWHPYIGYLAAGYEYLNLDDCWQSNERDENGTIIVDSEAFPSGIKALADYVHSRGTKKMDTLIRFSNTMFSSSITIIITFLRVAHQVLSSAFIAVQAEKHVQVNAHHHAFESRMFTDDHCNNRKDGVARIRKARCCYICWMGCRLSQGTRHFWMFHPLLFSHPHYRCYTYKLQPRMQWD